MALSWRLKDPREADASNTSALGSYQMWTGRSGHWGKVLRLTLTFDIRVPAHDGGGDPRRQGLSSTLVAAGSHFLARQAAVFIPIVLLHLFAFYVLANDESRLSRALKPIVVRFVPLEKPTKPPDPPMLPPGALDIHNTLMNVVLPQLEMDAFDAFSSPAPSRVETPAVAAPKKEEEERGEKADDGPLVRPRPIRGPTGIDRYPSGAIAAKESGRATITICIAATGKVEKVELAKSTGFERLDNAALDIARQYEFHPAIRNGKPIPVCLPYSINYKLR